MKMALLQKLAKKHQRVTDKEIKKEYSEWFHKIRGHDSRTDIIAKNVLEAKKLSEKYDFDADDGGGGSSKESDKAGKRYMQLWEENERLGILIDADANKMATAYLVEKYGEKRLKAVKRHNIEKGMIIIGGLVAAGAGGLVLLDKTGH